MAAHRILIVDDSELYRATLAALLEEHDITVEEAGDLTEARALLTEHVFDCVLLDVNLGNERGPDLIPVVRAAFDRTSIVVLTGHDIDEPTEGADATLSKMSPPDALLSHILPLLR